MNTGSPSTTPYSPHVQLEGENDDISEAHGNVIENYIPTEGMEFDSEQDAYDFYNSYAKRVGFSVRRKDGHKNAVGDWRNRGYCCSCQGKRGIDSRDRDTKRPRAETRFNCLAEMKIHRQNNGKYVVTKFISEHTHVLASPRKCMFLRSHRRINSMQKVEVDLAGCSGISPKTSIELMSKRVGGMHNLAESYDSMIDFGSRYKALVRLYSHLAARASLTKESFQIAVNAHNNILKDVESSLEGLPLKEYKQGSPHENTMGMPDERSGQATLENDATKRLRLKKKITTDKTSKRRQSALERATKKRRLAAEDKSRSQILTSVTEKESSTLKHEFSQSERSVGTSTEAFIQRSMLPQFAEPHMSQSWNHQEHIQRGIDIQSFNFIL